MNFSLLVYLIEKEELVPIQINVTKDNFYKVKFKIEYELNKLRKRFKILEKRGIISHIKGYNPKSTDFRYSKKLKNLSFSRRNLINSLRVLKSRNVYK